MISVDIAHFYNHLRVRYWLTRSVTNCYYVDRDFDVKTSYIKDESAKLFEYGERLYDNLILLSSQSKSMWLMIIDINMISV